MKKLIEEFPSNISQAIEIANAITFTKPKNTVTNIVICGMGGSGIGGKIVSQWLEADLKMPVILCQDYVAPSFVGPNTLVIASSYSGNTEETLMCIEECKAKGGQIYAVTSGGKLEQDAKANGWPYVIVPGGNPPRSALAFSLVQLVKLFVDLGMAPASRMDELHACVALLNDNNAEVHAIAKDMAEKIGAKTPIFYASARYEGIAIRAKQQFNENSKKLCWSHVVPEMNHNELVGWGGGNETHMPVFINSGDFIERNAKRWEISKARTLQKTSSLIEIFAKGNSQIERSLYLNNIIDWASWYHANINGVDPIEIEIINYLKGEMAKI